MIWLWSAVAVFVLASLLLFKLLRGSFSEPKDLAALVTRLQPVNPKSLAQLTSQEDDALLRRILPQSQYRELKKQRLLVLRSYCRAALRNCGVLQGCGQVLQREPDPETRNFGRQLTSSTLRLRPHLLKAIALAQLGAWVPGFNMDVSAVSRGYASTVERLRKQSGSSSRTAQQVLAQAFPAS